MTSVADVTSKEPHAGSITHLDTNCAAATGTCRRSRFVLLAMAVGAVLIVAGCAAVKQTSSSQVVDESSTYVLSDQKAGSPAAVMRKRVLYSKKTRSYLCSLRLTTTGCSTPALDGSSVARRVAAPVQRPVSAPAPTRPSALSYTYVKQNSPGISGVSPESFSGSSVDLTSDGQYLAVGEPGTNYVGQVRVYKRTSGGTWEIRGRTINGFNSGSGFGRGVAISDNGSVLVVNGYLTNGKSPYNTVLRTYDWSTTTSNWVLRGSDLQAFVGTTAIGPESELAGGLALTSDGTVVAFGMPGGLARPYVRVYSWNSSASPPSWSQRGSDIYIDYNTQLGSSVALSSTGNDVVIGAVLDSVSYVFTFDGSKWAMKGGAITGTATKSGYSVAMASDGKMIAIGSPYESSTTFSNSGATRVYNYVGSSWVQRGQTIYGFAPNEYSGAAVALTDDGNGVVVAAPRNGVQASKTRVFTWQGSRWARKGGAITTGTAPINGLTPYIAVAISGDASLVAIGNPADNTGGENQGLTSVFALAQT